MGDNGAGKSTMVKLIAGNFPPSDGEIAVDDKVCHFHKPIEARAEGIEVVYQDLALGRQSDGRAERVPRARDQEGVLAVPHPRQAGDDRPIGRSFSPNSSRRRGPRDLVKKMSGGQRQAVAIARTRLSNAKLVLMDEPTAAISVRQVAEVLELIRRLKSARRIRDADQPPHAGRVRRVRPHHRVATRLEGRGQDDRSHVAGRNHRPDYGSDPCSVAKRAVLATEGHAVDRRRGRRSRSRRFSSAVVCKPGLLGGGRAFWSSSST